MSHGSALQRRHLAKRPEQPGGAHEHQPAEQPEPEAAGVVVRRELRREAVECIREARAGRNHEARAARGAAQGEGQEREGCEDGERHPEARALAVRRVTSGSCKREERHASGHRHGGEDLAASDMLAELVHCDEEEEDQRHAEHRLDERERRFRQRVRLSDPADDAERRPGDPARPAKEAGEKREAKRALGRLLPRLERLQSHPERKHRRGAERSKNADQKRRHERQRP